APLPAAADALDELLVALPRGTPVRLDPRLGFHFYGADVCLQARGLGLPAAVVDAPCLHNARTATLAPSFYASAAAFTSKWSSGRRPAPPGVRVARRGGVGVGGAGGGALPPRGAPRVRGRAPPSPARPGSGRPPPRGRPTRRPPASG